MAPSTLPAILLLAIVCAIQPPPTSSPDVASAPTAAPAPDSGTTPNATTAPATSPQDTFPGQTVIEFLGDVALGDMVFSPDGNTLYVSLNISAINLWSILVYVWPEIAAALLTLIALLFARRHYKRRGRVPGEPYCRRCNYQLTQCASAKCPECGAPLTARNRVIAKRFPRIRFAAALATVFLLPTTWWLTRTSLPRRGSACQWFDWASTRLYDRASTNRWKWLIDNHKVFVCRIVAIDAVAGRIDRTLVNNIDLESDDNDRRVPKLLLADHGRVLLVSRRTTVDRRDVRTGALLIRHQANTAAEEHAIVSDIAISGPDERLIAVSLLGGLLAWTPDSVQPVVLREPGQLQNPNEGWSRLVASPRSSLVIEAVDPFDYPQHFDVCDSPGSPPRIRIDPKGRVGTAVLSPDENDLYIVGWLGVEHWSLATGRFVGFLWPPDGTRAWGAALIGRENQILMRVRDASSAARAKGRFVVYDIDSAAWIASVPIREIFHSGPVTSPDGRYAACRAGIVVTGREGILLIDLEKAGLANSDSTSGQIFGESFPVPFQ